MEEDALPLGPRAAYGAVMTSPSRAAARVEHSTTVRVLARVGLASIGILHILIGGLALAVAFGSGGNADQSGALQALVAVPGGLFAVWLIIVGLIALALWQILVAVTARSLGTRALEITKCVVYAALAVVAISIASGGSHDASSSERTMSIAQGLYERGLITYMRTDSTSLSEQAVSAARSQIRKLYGDAYLPDKPREYRSKVKNAQEAHEAIRPAGDRFRTPDDVRRDEAVISAYLGGHAPAKTGATA